MNVQKAKTKEDFKQNIFIMMKILQHSFSFFIYLGGRRQPFENKFSSSCLLCSFWKISYVPRATIKLELEFLVWDVSNRVHEGFSSLVWVDRRNRRVQKTQCSRLGRRRILLNNLWASLSSCSEPSLTTLNYRLMLNPFPFLIIKIRFQKPWRFRLQSGIF